jgi:hypothetical protein
MEEWRKVATESLRESQRLEKKNVQLIKKIDEVIAPFVVSLTSLGSVQGICHLGNLTGGE